MNYISTRNKKIEVTLSEALSMGLSSDGGLFIPKNIPNFSKNELNKLKNLPFEKFSYELLKPYFKDDKLESHLKEICKKSFNFPLILNKLDNSITVLELFHGPTNKVSATIKDKIDRTCLSLSA